MLKQRVVNAYKFAEEKHSTQYRKFTGLPYFTHPKGVARMIEALTKDEDMIIAALLHDIVEDCDVSIKDIDCQFGENVAHYVDGLTSDKQICKSKGKANYLMTKMLILDANTFIIKLADRLDNVRYMDRDCKTLEHKKFVKRYYLENLEN